jgi:uncharacterized membrane protein YfcA
LAAKRQWGFHKLGNLLSTAVNKFYNWASRLTPEKISFLGVFVIAVALRLIAWSNTPVIAPDGVIYISQAKAIFYGQLEEIAKCTGVDILSVYPFLIALFYNVFSDWIIAAKAISFIFGVATIIPLYFLLRQFFDYKISALTSLIIAVNPFFVSTSVEILRGPIYWFFSVLGLYLFTVCIKKENQLFLLLSSISFLLAAWTRIEGILFFAVSFLYLLFKNRNIRSVLIFIFPAIIGFAVTFFIASFKDISIHDLHRGDDILNRIAGIFSGYLKISGEIKELAGAIDGSTNGVLKLFLVEARMNAWLIALGTLINRILETFFYPLVIPVLLGFGKLRKIKEDPRIFYFMLLVISSLLVLYFSIFYIWVLEPRYIALFILPSMIFAGFGLETIIKWSRRMFRVNRLLVIIFLACIMVLSTFPKNSKYRHFDKLVYKEISEFIMKQEGENQQAINVSASMATQRYISFYTNLNYKGAICHNPSMRNCWELFAEDDYFIQQLKRRNIKYFLWTEKTWLNNNIKIAKYEKYLKELGRWKHYDTGEMILFEVM